MKFVCKQEELWMAVQTVQNVVATKNTLPILANVLLETVDNQVKFVANDLEVGLRCSMNAEILKKGSTTVPAKKLSEIVRELPAGKDVEINVNDSHQMDISYEGGKGKIRLLGLPVDDFPILPEFKADKSISLQQKDLKEMISRISFAVSVDPTRYVLNGALLLLDQKKISLVATDGYRLAMVEKTMEAPAKDKKNVIVPSKALAELSRLLRDAGEVKVEVLENQILFLVDQLLLTSRLIDGQFPNYEQVIPKKADKKIRVSTESLLRTSRRVSVLSAEKGASIKMEAQKNRLIITASTPELGEASEEIAAAYDGEPITVAYNGRYLQDVLKVLNDAETSLELTEPLNPTLVRPGGDAASYLCVIMPMRV